MPTTGTAGNDTITNTTPGAVITALEGDDIINDTGPATSVDGGPGIDTLNLDVSASSAAQDLTFTQNQPTGRFWYLESFNLTTGAGNDLLSLNINRVDCSNSWNGGAGIDSFSYDDTQLVMHGTTVTLNGASYSLQSIQCSSLGVTIGARKISDGQTYNFPVVTLTNVENFRWVANTFGSSSIATSITIGTSGDWQIFDGGTAWLSFDTSKAIGGVKVDLNYADVETTYQESAYVQNVGGGFGNLWLADPIRVHGTWYDDILIGDAADNMFEGDLGGDIIDGGTGIDTARFSGNYASYAIVEKSYGGYNISGPDGVDNLYSIEKLVFSDQTVTLSNPGEPWSRTINGTSASEIVSGGCGRDAISAGGGDDRVCGMDGDDALYGEAGDDTLEGGPGDDFLFGGSGVDTAIYRNAASAYTITQTSPGEYTVTGPEGTDYLRGVESMRFGDLTFKRLLPGSGTSVNWTADPSTYMGAIRDFDGNSLGGTSSWKLIGTADVNGDGSAEHILFNREIGRWAEVGTETDHLTYFANHGWGGDTRVVGIYIDPLVTNGTVVKDSATDSQRRFQNDLMIDNIKGILGFGDYNHDYLQEVYFSLTDGTAYLHAYMHADGNIQYANYQSKQQVIDYLTANGVASSTWSTWFPASQATMEVVSSAAPDLATLGGTTAWAAATGG